MYVGNLPLMLQLQHQLDTNKRSSHRRRLLLLLLLYRRRLRRNQHRVQFLKRRAISKLTQDTSSRSKEFKPNGIPRKSLVNPNDSAWRKLYNSGDDGSLFVLTGFDHATFEYIRTKFEPIYKSHTMFTTDGKIHKLVCKSGRKRMLTAVDVLGLYLTWTRTKCQLHILCLLFGMGKASISLNIRFARRIILHVLKDDDDARIRIPTADEIERCKIAISRKYPLLKDVWSTMDGLRVDIEEPGDVIVQNRFHNGWYNAHNVVNVFVFTAFGTICLAGIGFPGCYHDSTLSDDIGIYSTLRKINERTQGKCVVDSAFNLTQYGDCLIQSSKSLPLGGDAHDICLDRQATAFRQSSEWGMRQLQGSFPRLKDRLRYEETGERNHILLSLVYLHNLRTNRIGRNQIRTVFMDADSLIENL